MWSDPKTAIGPLSSRCVQSPFKGEPAQAWASLPMLYRRFEQLIDIFREAPTAAPPNTVTSFYVYYLRQVWPSFAALLVVGLIGALIEVSLFSYLSRIIDLAQGTPNPNFFREHALELTWMVVVALVLRPIFVALHALLGHRTLSPGW